VVWYGYASDPGEDDRDPLIESDEEPREELGEEPKRDSDTKEEYPSEEPE